MSELNYYSSQYNVLFSHLQVTHSIMSGARVVGPKLLYSNSVHMQISCGI